MTTTPTAGNPPRAVPCWDPAIAARLERDQAMPVAAIAQQYDTGEALMLGWMDDEPLHQTLTTGRCTYSSSSRPAVLGEAGTWSPVAASGAHCQPSRRPGTGRRWGQLKPAGGPEETVLAKRVSAPNGGDALFSPFEFRSHLP